MLDSFETVCRKVDRKPGPAARLYFWRGGRNGTFPLPVKVSPGRIAWRTEEVDAHLASLKPVHYAGARASAR